LALNTINQINQSILGPDRMW